LRNCRLRVNVDTVGGAPVCELHGWHVIFATADIIETVPPLLRALLVD